MNTTTTDLYVRAAALCSRSEHCASQIKEKLSAWGASPDDTDGIIARLIEERFIDNRRFARAYCHDKFAYNHWGRVKIRQMLRSLSIDETDIAEGLAVIPQKEYLQTLKEALLAKDKTLKDKDLYQRTGKLIRHLMTRGFEADLIYDVIEKGVK